MGLIVKFVHAFCDVMKLECDSKDLEKLVDQAVMLSLGFGVKMWFVFVVISKRS